MYPVNVTVYPEHSLPFLKAARMLYSEIGGPESVQGLGWSLGFWVQVEDSLGSRVASVTIDRCSHPSLSGEGCYGIATLNRTLYLSFSDGETEA